MSANLQSESLRLPIFVTWLLAQNQCGSAHLDKVRAGYHEVDTARLESLLHAISHVFTKRSKDSFVYISNWISPFWFANTATQKPWLRRGQIYPFNMRGLTNFYVTDPLVTHWRCSSSVAGIKWIRSWGVSAQNFCEIPDKLSFSGSRAWAEWVGGQMHEKKSLTICCCDSGMKADLQASPWMEIPPPPQKKPRGLWNLHEIEKISVALDNKILIFPEVTSILHTVFAQTFEQLVSKSFLGNVNDVSFHHKDFLWNVLYFNKALQWDSICY